MPPRRQLWCGRGDYQGGPKRNQDDGVAVPPPPLCDSGFPDATHSLVEVARHLAKAMAQIQCPIFDGSLGPMAAGAWITDIQWLFEVISYMD